MAHTLTSVLRFGSRLWYISRTFADKRVCRKIYKEVPVCYCYTEIDGVVNDSLTRSDMVAL